MFDPCRAVFALVFAAGCGNSAASSADAGLDTPIALDAPVVPRTYTQYVLDDVRLPADATEAAAYAFDLDGDASADNGVARVLAAYAAMGFQNQQVLDVWLARGQAIMLAQLGAEDFTNDADATFALYHGAQPMPPACAGPGFTNCGKHLLGTGSFIVDGAPVPALGGAIANGVLAAGPGPLAVQFSLGYSPPIRVQLVGARVELTPTGTTLAGKIGGAIPQSEITANVLPALRESFATAVYLECDPFGDPPACDCAAGGLGEKVIGQLDTAPADCGISLAEVQADVATAALLAPDVVVDGQPALSIGLGVTAVHGTFAVPQ